MLKLPALFRAVTLGHRLQIGLQNLPLHVAKQPRLRVKNTAQLFHIAQVPAIKILLQQRQELFTVIHGITTFHWPCRHPPATLRPS